MKRKNDDGLGLKQASLQFCHSNQREEALS